MNAIASRFRQVLITQPALRTLVAGIAAFGAYSCMYAFRKGFTAGVYEGRFWGMDYKVWLVLAQVLGYMLSKFAGIRYVSAMKAGRRAQSVFVLIGISWFALLLFAVIPRPFSIFCLLLNGLPLGMIWGIVFSYLEGRRTTELMGTIMSASLIFSSGLAKTVGKFLLLSGSVAEPWMPFTVGLVFALPLVFFVGLLGLIPPPDAADIAHRAPRLPMTSADRKRFLQEFLPGILLTLALYLLLTSVRDMRDNFEVEIWTALGFGSRPGIFTQTDIPIALAVLLMMGLLTLVKENRKAFGLIHLMVFAGCAITGIATLLFNFGLVGPVLWMSFSGLGLFMAYIPYNALFFERMIATFRIAGNVGFVMYLADSCGYLGTLSMLLIKQFGPPQVSWLHSFIVGNFLIATIGAALSALSFFYFRMKYSGNLKRVARTQKSIQYG